VYTEAHVDELIDVLDTALAETGPLLLGNR
jgi:hypothetical protein